MSFEIIKENIINTTTQIVLTSNTSSAANIFYRDPKRQYLSSGFADDMTTSVITISFASTLTISRIALLEVNWKLVDIYYNGATANTFALSNAETTTSRWTQNSASGLYLRFDTVAVATSVSFAVKSTQVANYEKAVGLIHLSDTRFTFTRDPSAKNYSPSLDPKRITHELSDGGRRVHHIADKWNASIKLQAIPSAFKDSLRTIYALRAPVAFCPLGTSTGW